MTKYEVGLWKFPKNGEQKLLFHWVRSNIQLRGIVEKCLWFIELESQKLVYVIHPLPN